MTQMQTQPPTQTTPPAKTPIPYLLADFAKNPYCDRYTSDAQQLKLLLDYLWCRQLVPDLSFEIFLDRYKAVANFDDDNLKHPADAVSALMPKTAAKAGDGKKWTGSEIVDYLSLYVDVVREAEAAGVNPPELTAFLRNPGLIEAFSRGDFALPKPRKGKAAPKATAPVKAAPPDHAGERCVLTTPEQVQHRGVLASPPRQEGDVQVADFQADSGELFTDTFLRDLQKSADAPRQANALAGGQPPVNGSLRIPKSEYAFIKHLRSMGVALGTVPQDTPAYTYKFAFEPGKVAIVTLINAVPMYVDAALYSDEAGTEVLYEVPPRENLLGSYEFLHDGRLYVLNVVAYED